MKLNTYLAFLIFLALALGCMPSTKAADVPSAQDRVQQQTGSEGSRLGVPEPGSVGDQETTRKQRNPAKDQRTEQNAQVTLGGAQYTVTGELLKIEGTYYFVRDDESNGEIRLVVNKDTRLLCPGMADPHQQGAITKQQGAGDSGASEQQLKQGQKRDETAMGGGFQIAPQSGCAFKPGDRVKAEVSDLGTVTTLKYQPEQKRSPGAGARAVGESAGTGELAISKQEKPGQLDMTGAHGYPPKQYLVLPLPQGEFKAASEERLLFSAVKYPDGKPLGTIKNLIMDSNTGQIEYAEVLLLETHQLVAVPWAQFKRGENPQILVLNTMQFQVEPALSERDTKDKTPKVEQTIGDMNRLIAPAELRGEEAGKGGEASSAHKSKSEDVTGKVLRGKLVKIENEFYTVKDKAGREVRLHVDSNTRMGNVNLKDEFFKEGDRVEAYVTPTGHAHSLSILRAQPNSPNDPEGGG
jgi:exosome complex RNA-binding protein Csl4